LTADADRWIAHAQSLVEERALRDLLVELIAIPAPTGGEGPFAEYLSSLLKAAGMEASTQPLGGSRANAIGVLPGHVPSARSLMLYAAIDTHLSGDDDVDAPFLNGSRRADMLPRAEVRDDGIVLGLGAGNPKAHVASIVRAGQIAAEAGAPLAGDLVVALCAGGMPMGGLDPDPERGHLIGCERLLAEGPRVDCAVVGKPGWNVSWEEAGYTWYEIEIAGNPGYAGSRHKVPYRNPLLPAAELVGRLEEWVAGYTARNASGQVEPHGVVSAIHGGTSRALANTPGWCRVYADLRHSPRMAPADADAELGAFLEEIAAELDDFQLTWRRIAQVEAHEGPGRGPLFDLAVRAWEQIEGSEHEVVGDNSGASEANLLRRAGIETVKVGLPKVAAPGLISDFHMGMDSADPRSMVLYTRFLLEVIGRICSPAAVEAVA